METLAHHHTRAVHWLATASAMAAVIAAAGLLQPSAGAATGPEETTRTSAGTPADPAEDPRATAPDARALTYPLDCNGAPQIVTDTAQGDLDGDGRPETVAAVRCDAGSGTPPHALYVVTRDRGEGARPRVVATLLDTARRQTVSDLTVRDGAVTASLLGYSSPDIPRFSPDTKHLAKWRWSDGKFRQELTDSAPTRV
ncbi:hypothetical protein CG724_19950 [Streptomyces sp. CB02120-2]|nr:hypothetical protein [Streptomyces sp. KCTC 0041BP]OKI41564.1 hypothetical protein A6A28_27320 [Streptomyces sp. CB03578]PJN17299.1 hypothetical protein CG724_19950 [Streptomyces sp. CB02120-2]